MITLTAPARAWSDWKEGKEAETKHLWIALFLLIGMIGLQMMGLYKMYVALRSQPVRILRIGPDGKGDELKLQAMTYVPHAEEAKYYLRLWARCYYGRVHHKFAETHALAARFFHEDIAESRMKLVRQETETFAKDEAAAETEITSRVTIRDLEHSPYQAELQIEKITWTSQRSIAAKEHWTVNVRFLMTGTVPYELSEHNPVGVLIQSMQEDRVD